MMTVVDHAVDSRLGRYMGYYSGISRMGSISGNLLGAVGHDLIGFTATLLLFALLSGVMVPLGPIARRVSPPLRQSTADDTARRPNRALLMCGFVSGAVGQGGEGRKVKDPAGLQGRKCRNEQRIRVGQHHEHHHAIVVAAALGALALWSLGRGALGHIDSETLAPVESVRSAESVNRAAETQRAAAQTVGAEMIGNAFQINACQRILRIHI